MCEQANARLAHAMHLKFKTKISDGFNRLRTVQPHRAPEIHQKVAPLLKKLLNFFIVAPGCQ